jgi:hypothetical protein
MAYIRTSSHNVPLVLQIAEDGHARVYAHVLHARFGFYLTSIYIEEEVMLESSEVERSILQLRFRDNDGHHWVLPPGRYRAFGLTTGLMAASIDLLSQPSDMSSVQPPLLHSVKLEFPDGLVYLSSDSLEGELPLASLPSPVAHTPKTDSKYTEHSKSIFTPVGSSSHSNLSRPPFHPNTRECPSVMQCLKRLASIPRSRNELASIDYDKIAYQKVQYLPPSYNGDVIFELPPSRVSVSTSRIQWTVWISSLMVIHGAAP